MDNFLRLENRHSGEILRMHRRQDAEGRIVLFLDGTLNISLREMDPGSWMIVELPGYSSASTGTAQTSLDALRSASSTSYYRGEGTLWVKLVSNGDGARPGRGGRGGVPPSSIQVSR